MTISTVAQINAAARQRVTMVKGLTVGLSLSNWNSLWDGTGNPGAGSFAIGNTANGLVPDNTTTGAVQLQPTSGNVYLDYLEHSDNQYSEANRVLLYDRLWHGGSYPFNASVTLSSQPSFSARLPSGAYTGLQIWIEHPGTNTGLLNIGITYTNESGVTGRSTTVSAPGTAKELAYQCPLQAGDCGVQKIEGVTCTTATAGSFNVIIARPLKMWYSHAVCGQYQEGRYTRDQLGFREIPANACLSMFVNGQSNSGSGGNINAEFDLVAA